MRICVEIKCSFKFRSYVNSLRPTQSSIKRFQVKSEPSILLTKGVGSSQAKVCAYSKRKGYVRNSCFVWFDTPEDPKWAIKSLGKASKVLKSKSMFMKKRSEVDDEKEGSGSSFDGVWMIGENFLSTNTDVVLDTSATRHIHCGISAFVSLTLTRKSI